MSKGKAAAMSKGKVVRCEQLGKPTNKRTTRNKLKLFHDNARRASDLFQKAEWAAGEARRREHVVREHIGVLNSAVIAGLDQLGDVLAGAASPASPDYALKKILQTIGKIKAGRNRAKKAGTLREKYLERGRGFRAKADAAKASLVEDCPVAVGDIILSEGDKIRVVKIQPHIYESGAAISTAEYMLTGARVGSYRESWWMPIPIYIPAALRK